MLKKLWIIRTDRMDPWWKALWVFKATKEQAEKYFEFVKNNIDAVEDKEWDEGEIFLEQWEEEDIYHLTHEDVDALKAVGVERKVGDEYFIDGDLRKNQIISSKNMEDMIERVKQEINQKKS